MKLEPKALEAAEAALQEMHFDSYGMIDEIAEAAITAYLATASAEAICWLPTKTIEWLETYDGPACGTQTIAHNRPIKTDGGVPLYLAPRATEAPAVTDEKALARARTVLWGAGFDVPRDVLTAALRAGRKP